MTRSYFAAFALILLGTLAWAGINLDAYRATTRLSRTGITTNDSLDVATRVTSGQVNNSAGPWQNCTVAATFSGTNATAVICLVYLDSATDTTPAGISAIHTLTASQEATGIHVQEGADTLASTITFDTAGVPWVEPRVLALTGAVTLDLEAWCH